MRERVLARFGQRADAPVREVGVVVVEPPALRAVEDADLGHVPARVAIMGGALP